MAYRFKTDEGIKKGIRRIAREQIKGALSQAGRAKDDPIDAIHSARRHTKMLRALFRLARSELEAYGSYAQDDDTVKKAAAALSAQRDADVALKTLTMLHEQNKWAIEEKAVERLQKRLAKQRSDSVSKKSVQQALDVYAGLMVEEGERIESWKIKSKGKKTLQRGFARTYMNARKAMEKAQASDEPDALHDWRKHVKYHLYHVRLVKPLATKDTAKRQRQAFRLEKLLGEHHDLAMLDKTIGAMKTLSKKNRHAARDVIRDTSDKRRIQALRLGYKLFYKKRAPNLFA